MAKRSNLLKEALEAEVTRKQMIATRDGRAYAPSKHDPAGSPKRFLDSNGNVGRTANLNPANPDQQQTVLNIVCDDVLAERITLTLMMNTVKFPTIPAPLDHFAVFLSRERAISAVAIVEWGVAGVGGQAEVDFCNGTTFSLAASFVRINAKIEATTIVGGTEMKVGVIASHLPCSTAFPPRRTRYFGAPVGAAIAPAIAVGVSIPPFANSVRVAIQTGAGLPTSFQMIFFSTSAPFSGYVIDVPAGVNLSESIPLSNDINAMSILNTGANPIVAGRAIFDLAL